MAVSFVRNSLFFQCRLNQIGFRQINNCKQSNANFSYIYSKRHYCLNSETKAGAGWPGIVRGMVPIGLCLVAVMQWRAFRQYNAGSPAKPWQVQLYCALPLRAFSRIWGWIAERQIPEALRPVILGLYASAFGVNLNEAENPDLRYYPSLAAFFARGLREGVRPQDSTPLTSPCDGKVLFCGPVTSDYLEQVKGVEYALDEFVGDREITIDDYKSTLLQDKSNNLYQCILYLAPGDYHRFHSPCEWQPSIRRHVSGKLLSVSPSIASWIPGLFCLNERAVYLGRWLHGFFSMAAVGATNVGSVRIYKDPTLHTNKAFTKYGCMDEIALPKNTKMFKGDEVGEFRMGSTIVLVFEAPPTFRFRLLPGQTIQVGQTLGTAHETYVERVIDNHTHSHASINVS